MDMFNLYEEHSQCRKMLQVEQKLLIPQLNMSTKLHDLASALY